MNHTRLIDYLRQAPENTVVTWRHDNAEIADGVLRASFCDVSAPTLQAHLGLGWLLTVVSPQLVADSAYGPGPGPWDPSRPEDVNNGEILLAGDVTVHTVWDRTTAWYPRGAGITVAAGQDTTPEVASAVSALAQELLDQGHQVGPAEAVPGWTLSAVNAALTAWAQHHTVRQDITFVHDPSLAPASADPAISAAAAALAVPEPSRGERYEIAPGLFAADEAFDQLLAMDPDTAAQVTTWLQEFLGMEQERTRSLDR